jgi:elongator complex protein 1
MSLLRLNLEHPAVDVAVSKSGTRLAVLSDRSLSVYTIGISIRPVPAPELLWRSDVLQGHVPRHVAFLGDERVCVLTDSWNEQESYLWSSQGEELICCGPILESGRISSLVTSLDNQKLYVQYQDGALYHVELGDDLTSSPPQTTLVFKASLFAPEVVVVQLEGKVRVYQLTQNLSLTVAASGFRPN